MQPGLLDRANMYACFSGVQRHLGRDDTGHLAGRSTEENLRLDSSSVTRRSNCRNNNSLLSGYTEAMTCDKDPLLGAISRLTHKVAMLRAKNQTSFCPDTCQAGTGADFLSQCRKMNRQRLP
jgi:hypothetical protein